MTLYGTLCVEVHFAFPAVLLVRMPRRFEHLSSIGELFASDSILNFLAFWRK